MTNRLGWVIAIVLIVVCKTQNCLAHNAFVLIRLSCVVVVDER